MSIYSKGGGAIGVQHVMSYTSVEKSGNWNILSGFSKRYVAGVMNYHHSTIIGLWVLEQRQGNVNDRHRNRCPLITTTN